MSVTQYYKSDKELTPEKNGVVAITRSLLRLQLVGEAEVEQTLNDLKELAKASYANGAVDITVLVSDGNLHAFKSNFIHRACLQSQYFEDIGVKVSYLFTDHQGRDLCVPHETLLYVVKYESVAGNGSAVSI